MNIFLSVFQSEPIRVLVTGAAGQIAYSLLLSIAKGDVFGSDQVKKHQKTAENVKNVPTPYFQRSGAVHVEVSQIALAHPKWLWASQD